MPQTTRLCPWLLARTHEASTCPVCSPTPSVSSELLIKAAKEYGKKHDFRGNGGGWISNGHYTVCQGWHSFGITRYRAIADYYTKRLTAFDSFAELLNTHESYSPTILQGTWREQFLADAFDTAMYKRKSSRRAWRGSGGTLGN